MASPSVTKRIALAVLSDALEDGPAIEVDGDTLELPTEAIVERLLMVAVDVKLRRSRTLGDVVDLTFRLAAVGQPLTAGGG